jgi:predicted nuclease of predicted toxin-antitoxin system
MRFLADESCDFAMVRALRTAGHDVLAVADISPRAPDTNVIDLAVKENRILLTEDKDFGQLVYSSGTPSAGVVLLRYTFKARVDVARALPELVRQKGDRLAGASGVHGLQSGGLFSGRGTGVLSGAASCASGTRT